MLNRLDEDHARAQQYASSSHHSYITSELVLIELADALSSPPARRKAIELIMLLRSQRATLIIEMTRSLFDEALDLYSRRHDKSWSLTDCSSFVSMSRYNLTRALTADHHFEQAGFVPLLRA